MTSPDKYNEKIEISTSLIEPIIPTHTSIILDSSLKFYNRLKTVTFCDTTCSRCKECDYFILLLKTYDTGITSITNESIVNEKHESWLKDIKKMLEKLVVDSDGDCFVKHPILDKYISQPTVAKVQTPQQFVPIDISPSSISQHSDLDECDPYKDETPLPGMPKTEDEAAEMVKNIITKQFEEVVHVDTKKAFRLQGKKVHLTYATHFDHATYLNWFNISGTNKIKKYSIVNETGAIKGAEFGKAATEGYKHTHVLLEFTGSLNVRKASHFDYTPLDVKDSKSLHPNIKKVTTSEYWNRCVVYHRKQAVPFTNISNGDELSMIEKVMACKSRHEAVMVGAGDEGKLNSVSGALAAFDVRKRDFGPEPHVDWRDWQKKLRAELDEKPDDRKIIWYYDEVGKSGKSYLSKHMGKYQKAFVCTTTKIYHAATGLANHVNRHGDPSIVLINFTRETNPTGIYNCLESMKDGMVFVQKYQSDMMYFESPHVIIFANFAPDVSKMSSDRWDIRTVVGDKVTSSLDTPPLVDDEILINMLKSGNSTVTSSPNVSKTHGGVQIPDSPVFSHIPL
jgi:hypothetical protein